MKRVIQWTARLLVLGMLWSCASDDATARGIGIEPNPSPSPMDDGGFHTDGGADSAGTTGGAGGDVGGEGPNDGTGTGDTGMGCVPFCQPGWECGPDGCGGSCGVGCPAGETCDPTAHQCVDPALAPPAEGDSSSPQVEEQSLGIGLVPGGAQDAAYYRSLVMAGEVPEPDLLPIEGWLNEQSTPLPPALTDRVVTLHAFMGLLYDPQDGEPTVALQLGMNSALSADAIQEGQFNLSVVIDRSGSMNDEGKLEFVKEGLSQMLDVLDEGDLLSVVTYSTTAKVALAPLAMDDDGKAQVQAFLDELPAGGKTNLWGGLKLGYEQVMLNAADSSRTPRVVLLSDGVANSGTTSPAQILAESQPYNDAGIGLTTIGVGEDLNFELMHQLSLQGGGNFYFVDSPEKLLSVFTDEIEYLLTPVAEQLQVWFSLPDGFGVEQVYGFDFEVTDGEIHLVGPTPTYSVGPDGVPLPDPDPVDPEEPGVAVSTVFASKRNGLLMVKIQSPGANLLAELEQTEFANVSYAYRLAETGEEEGFDVSVQLGSMEYDDEGGFQYFSGAIMQRNFCLLRAGLAMKGASTHVHESGDAGITPAIQGLAQARTFCNGINVQLDDEKVSEAVVLVEQLMENVCADCLDPGAE